VNSSNGSLSKIKSKQNYFSVEKISYDKLTIKINMAMFKNNLKRHDIFHDKTILPPELNNKVLSSFFVIFQREL
jgi:hypothetical protein